MKRDYLNAFAEKASQAGFTFTVGNYGNAEAVTVDGEKLPPMYCNGLFFVFKFTPHDGENDHKTENLFCDLLKRYRTIDILTAYSVHYGNAYVIVTATDAEKLRADRDRKTEELDKFWTARHKAMQTATA